MTAQQCPNPPQYSRPRHARPRPPHTQIRTAACPTSRFTQVAARQLPGSRQFRPSIMLRYRTTPSKTGHIAELRPLSAHRHHIGPTGGVGDVDRVRSTLAAESALTTGDIDRHRRAPSVDVVDVLVTTAAAFTCPRVSIGITAVLHYVQRRYVAEQQVRPGPQYGWPKPGHPNRC